MALQLGAFWNSLVVMPLAKASEQLSRETPDLDGAAPNIDEGLRGIRTVKAATPAADRNLIRIEILERRVEGVRDFVAEKRGQRLSVEKDLIRLRAEAVALGPDLKYPAKFVDDADADSQAQATAPKAPEKAPAEVTGASPAEATKPPERVDSAPLTITEYWKQAVVLGMWEAQKEAETSPVLAAMSLRLAGANVLRFRNGTPVGEPTRLRLVKLFDGIDNLLPILDARAGNTIKSVSDMGIDAYASAEIVGKYLTGQQLEDEPEESEGSAAKVNEPDFTYENKRPNDTDLERP